MAKIILFFFSPEVLIISVGLKVHFVFFLRKSFFKLGFSFPWPFEDL